MTRADLSPRPARPSIRAPDVAQLVVERNEVVLWSLSPSGLVLHHVKRGAYLELDAAGYMLWAYLDGARTVGDAVATTARANPDHTTRRLLDMASTLFTNGFVVERR
jgi:hypothetical protein